MYMARAVSFAHLKASNSCLFPKPTEPWTGSVQSKIPMAALANPYFPITTGSESEGQEHRFANGVGVDRPACRAGPDDPAATRAAAWLISHQNENGTWDEDEFTGTGFPQVFYLKYHLYRNSFPLYALARYDNLGKGRTRSIGTRVAASEIEHPNGYWG